MLLRFIPYHIYYDIITYYLAFASGKAHFVSLFLSRFLALGAGTRIRICLLPSVSARFSPAAHLHRCCTFCAPPCLCCLPCGIRPCLFLGGLLNGLPCAPFCAPFLRIGPRLILPARRPRIRTLLFSASLSAFPHCFSAPRRLPPNAPLPLRSCALFPASAAVFTLLFYFCPAAAGSFPASRYPPHQLSSAASHGTSACSLPAVSRLRGTSRCHGSKLFIVVFPYINGVPGSVSFTFARSRSMFSSHTLPTPSRQRTSVPILGSSLRVKLVMILLIFKAAHKPSAQSRLFCSDSGTAPVPLPF